MATMHQAQTRGTTHRPIILQLDSANSIHESKNITAMDTNQLKAVIEDIASLSYEQLISHPALLTTYKRPELITPKGRATYRTKTYTLSNKTMRKGKQQIVMEHGKKTYHHRPSFPLTAMHESNDKKETDNGHEEYLATLTELAWSIKTLSTGIKSLSLSNANNIDATTASSLKETWRAIFWTSKSCIRTTPFIYSQHKYMTAKGEMEIEEGPKTKKEAEEEELVRLATFCKGLVEAEMKEMDRIAMEVEMEGWNGKWLWPRERLLDDVEGTLVDVVERYRALIEGKEECWL